MFLDRDGTINVKPAPHEYVTSPRDFVWLPGVVPGLARLAKAGFALTVVSNQRGVARGLVAPSTLREIEARIQSDLARYDCAVEAFRYCIHDLQDGCECRKPKPGMILDLARELDLDLAQSWLIGDSEDDIKAGAVAGCRTALIGESSMEVAPDIVAGSLAEASARIAHSRTSA